MNDLSHNAKFALVICEPPRDKTGHAQKHPWSEFLLNVETNVKLTSGIQKIHENVWQIPLNSGMPALTELFRWANHIRIPLRILFLDEEPTWITYPSDEQPKSEN